MLRCTWPKAVDSLRRCVEAGCLALDQRFAKDFENAASSLDRGVPWDEVVAGTRLPNFVRVRLQGISHSPSRAAAMFAEAAEACSRRHLRRAEVSTRVAFPVVLLVLGGIVAAHFFALMASYYATMHEVGA